MLPTRMTMSSMFDIFIDRFRFQDATKIQNANRIVGILDKKMLVTYCKFRMKKKIFSFLVEVFYTILGNKTRKFGYVK